MAVNLKKDPIVIEHVAASVAKSNAAQLKAHVKIVKNELAEFKKGDGSKEDKKAVALFASNLISVLNLAAVATSE